MTLRLQDLRRPRKLKTKGKRKGRGIGSGKGKTSGRGHKGAKARSGPSVYPGFEGGQMPLIRRLPKRGFTNKWRKEWEIVNIDTLQKSDAVEKGSVIDKEFLVAHGILSRKRLPFKVLGKGMLNKEITVRANGFSATAKEAIEKAGGKVEVVKE